MHCLHCCEGPKSYEDFQYTNIKICKVAMEQEVKKDEYDALVARRERLNGKELEVIPDVIKTEELSEKSRLALKSFGLNAMELLNDYACSVEDTLIAINAQRERLLKNVNYQLGERDNERNYAHHVQKKYRELHAAVMADDMALAKSLCIATEEAAAEASKGD